MILGLMTDIEFESLRQTHNLINHNVESYDFYMTFIRLHRIRMMLYSNHLKGVQEMKGGDSMKQFELPVFFTEVTMVENRKHDYSKSSTAEADQFTKFDFTGLQEVAETKK